MLGRVRASVKRGDEFRVPSSGFRGAPQLLGTRNWRRAAELEGGGRQWGGRRLLGVWRRAGRRGDDGRLADDTAQRGGARAAGGRKLRGGGDGDAGWGAAGYDGVAGHGRRARDLQLRRLAAQAAQPDAGRAGGDLRDGSRGPVSAGGDSRAGGGGARGGGGGAHRLAGEEVPGTGALARAGAGDAAADRDGAAGAGGRA